MKIAIVGMGGVGGFVGAALVRAGHECLFVARGAQLTAIKENGLTLNSDVLGEFTVRPALAAATAEGFGVADAVIVTVKSYALADAVELMRPMVGEHTQVVALLNGVDIGARIAAQLQKGQVLDGMIFIVSKIERPGVIRQLNKMNRIALGVNKNRPADAEAAKKLAEAINAAGINAAYSEKIEEELWRKYTFITASGCTMSVYGKNCGQVREDPAAMEDYKAVTQEIAAVAKALGVDIDDEPANCLKTLAGLTPDTTASLYRDWQVDGAPTEADLFCKHVAALGKANGVSTPVCERFAAVLTR